MKYRKRTEKGKRLEIFHFSGYQECNGQVTVKNDNDDET